jgi:hypothetical protein
MNGTLDWNSPVLGGLCRIAQFTLPLPPKAHPNERHSALTWVSRTSFGTFADVVGSASLLPALTSSLPAHQLLPLCICHTACFAIAGCQLPPGCWHRFSITTPSPNSTLSRTSRRLPRRLWRFRRQSRPCCRVPGMTWSGHDREKKTRKCWCACNISLHGSLHPFLALVQHAKQEGLEICGRLGHKTQIQQTSPAKRHRQYLRHCR